MSRNTSSTFSSQRLVPTEPASRPRPHSAPHTLRPLPKPARQTPVRRRPHGCRPIKDRVAKTQPMVQPAPAAHRVLLQQPQAGQRLTGIQDPSTGADHPRQPDPTGYRTPIPRTSRPGVVKIRKTKHPTSRKTPFSPPDEYCAPPVMRTPRNRLKSGQRVQQRARQEFLGDSRTDCTTIGVVRVAGWQLGASSQK